MNNGILHIGGRSIPVVVETIDIYYGEPNKITLREMADFRDLNTRPIYGMFSDTHACADNPTRRRLSDYALNILGEVKRNKPLLKESDIKDVIFNGPATIILWKDGTKTVVKCQDEDKDLYSPEAGIAIAIMKKVFGNKGNYNNVFNRLLDKANKEV